MTEPISIDRSKMTLGDLEDFEDYTGLSAADFFEGLEKEAKADIAGGGDGTGVKLPIKAVTALVWIDKRRENPDYTVQQARKIDITELQIMAQNAPVPSRAVRRATAKKTTKPAPKKSASAKSSARKR